MSIIDNRGRLFGKINVIDFLLILVILAAVAFGVYKVTQDSGALPVLSPTKKVIVEFYGNSIYPFVVENMNEGDTIRTLETNDVIGKLVSKRVEQAISLNATDDGRTVISKVPDKNLVYLQVEGEAKLVNGILTIGQTPLLVGYDLKIKGTDFSIPSVISKVTVVE